MPDGADAPTSGSWSIVRLAEIDMPAAARVHRTAFDERLPWLAGLHTPVEDKAYWAEHLFTECEIWGAFDTEGLAGVIAFRTAFVEQLYVLPRAQRRGIGTALLAIAKRAFPVLSLWTFQKNVAARAFYERNGFTPVEETDGSANEEREPDVFYVWSAEPDTRPA